MPSDQPPAPAPPPRRRRPRPRYAPDAEVERALHLARKTGLNPGGVTLDADGGITVFETGSRDSAPAPTEAPDPAREALLRRRERKAGECGRGAR